MQQGDSMLEVLDVTVHAQGKPVVQNVTLTVKPGQVTALLGANGAGKSELVLAMAGLLPVTQGRIVAQGRDLAGLSPDRIRAAGVAAVPEGHQVLTQLTVDENLRVAGSALAGSQLSRTMAETYETFPELAERKGQLAGSMSGGQQQMLAISHALMAQPQFILIDEMSLGLAPVIVRRLVDVVKDLAARGIGVLLVEQFVEVALLLATDVVVLRKGRVALACDVEQVKTDRDALVKAYL